MDFARLAHPRRKFGLGPPYALFKHTRAAFVFERVSHHDGQSLQWNIYPSIGRQNFRQKKGRGVWSGGGEGLAFCPWLLDCPVTNPSIHPPTRPSIAGRQANLSVFQRAETRDQCAFPFRRNFRVENRCHRIGSCGSVADGEEMSATRILYKRKKRNNRRGFHPLAYPRRAHARAKVVGKGGAHGYVHVCRINIYYVSRVRYLNTWGKSDSESRSYSRDFIFRMHSSLQISTTRKPVSLGAREIC